MWADMSITFLLSSSIFALLVLFSFMYLLDLTKKNNLNLPPSPPKLPIIGNLHQLGTLPHRSFRSLSEKYGPLMLLHFGKAPTLIVSSAEAVEEITKTHDLAFSSRPRIRASEVLFYKCSDVAFCPYGEYWRQVKKICVLELLSQKRVQAFEFVRKEEVANLVEKIRISCLNGAATINLSEMLLMVSNNMISRTALGRVYEKEVREKNLRELTKKVTDFLQVFSFQDMLPLLGWMDTLTGLVSSLNGTFKTLNEFLDQVIEEHQVLDLKNDKSEKQDLVDILLTLKKSGTLDIDLTRDNLKAILMDMFVGGTDNTATTMEWAMAELVKNPHIMKKAQEEIRATVGEKSQVCDSDINQMVYLKCIVKESIRLHAPANNLRATSASTKVGGFDIPSETRVVINTWAIQRDPKLWDRPEEFIPERFTETSVDFKGQHSQLMPFGGGRRICPGIHFAVAEVEYVLANLLCWFDWDLPNGTTAQNLDMSEVSSIVIRKKTPLLLVPRFFSP